jgi:uncharacterized protein (TIRG00374 family)
VTSPSTDGSTTGEPDRGDVLTTPLEPTPRPERVRRVLHIRIFAAASDAPRSRRPTDAILLVVTVLLVALFLIPAPDPTQTDTTISTFVQQLPGTASGLWQISYDLLLLWPLALLLATVFAHGRKKVFRDMVVALAIACAFVVLIAWALGTDAEMALRNAFSTGTPQEYFAPRLALAAAMIATASPHLSRPLRTVGRWILGLGALACIVLGVSLPLGTLAGFLTGLAGAATVHLIFGSSGGRLTIDDLAEVLGDLGVDATDVRVAPLAPGGAQLFLAATPEGTPLQIKVFGRDARGGEFLSSTWSSLRRKGRAVRAGSGWQQVEREALASLFAERAGVPVLAVRAVGTTPEGDGVMVLDADARRLTAIGADEIADQTIETGWHAFEQLGSAHLALGTMDADGMFVRPDGTIALGEFGDAAVNADDSAILADRAQFLVITALAVGADRAVAIAVRSIGKADLEAALPYLQHAALESSVWHEVKGADWSLDDLRVLAEQATGSAPKELERLGRVSWVSIGKLALIGFIAYALISAVSEVGLDTIVEEFQSANKAWVLAAIVLTPLVQIPQAFSTLGATLRPLKYFPVLMLQYGVQFIALAVPSSAARVALEIRFFERVGVPAAGAVTIGMIDSVSTFVIQITMLFAITVSGLASLHLFGSDSPSSTSSSIDWTMVAIACGLLLLAFVAALLVPRFRAMVKRSVAAIRDKAAGGREALQVLRQPRKLLLLFVGNFVAQVMLAVILGFCLEAFGYTATLAQLILINTFVCLFAGFMPVPGGVGVAEAAYTAGLVAIGIPEGAATSTALLMRLVTFYLPPAWGVFAMRWMRANRYL